MTRLWQVLIIAIGSVVALVMVFLGLWQMQVFENQGDSGARERLAQPAVPLDEVTAVGSDDTAGFGRTVTFNGEYLADQQLLIPVPESPGDYRVLTALERADGSVVPVVRGVTDNPSTATPPSGEQDQRGVLLASELSVDGEYGPDEMGSVRLPELARRWDQPIIPGYVTLTPELSAEQHLAEAPLALPVQGGNARNGGYALQWWVFAAAALGFSIYVSRDLGIKHRRRALVAAGLIEETPDNDNED